MRLYECHENLIGMWPYWIIDSFLGHALSSPGLTYVTGTTVAFCNNKPFNFTRNSEIV